ncbi:MAG TPA: PP2C family protein-serine/threonine phosphatase, partial [Solirubrobacteraceae bacterium]|nr:PP2C family protein-serine/threonine phosphatase [Solirubrobacteraceae bacterium]
SSSGSGSGTGAGASTGTGTRETATSAAATGAAGGAAKQTGAATAGHAASPAARRRAATAAAKRRRAAAQGAAAVASGGQAATALPTGAHAPASANARARAHSRKASAKGAASNPLTQLGRQIPFPVPVPDWSKPIILLLLLLAAWFAVRSRLAAVRARRLEGQRAVLLGDLDAMQAALVPAIPPRLGDVAVSVAYRPADGPAAGGDFYDVFALEPGKVAIVLGDVAGHGRGALTQAALTRYTLRAYMQAGLEPRAALALAGSVLSEPGEMQFATVVVAIYDSVAGSVTYASGGHPPPISIGFQTPEPPTVCCSAPVGCHLPTGRRQTTIAVPPGGRVCFFSDGLLEARTADGLLGRERLAELAAELDPGDSAASLLGRVREDAQATPDDMVACIVSSAVAAPAPGAYVEELEVDRDVLARASVPVFLDVCRVRAGELAPLLARARELVEQRGTALLRIERAPGSQTVAAVLPGLSLAASKAAIGRAAEAPTLALR